MTLCKEQVYYLYNQKDVFSNVGKNITFKKYVALITEYKFISTLLLCIKQMELTFLFLQFSENVGRMAPYTAAGFQGANPLS